MARVSAANSGAYVLGPAVSAALILVNLRFPFFVAGAISGIAFILSFFFLKESNMAYLQRKQQQQHSAAASTTATATSVSVPKESHSSSSSAATSERVRFKPILPFCLFLEFCTSWTCGCYNSRYAIYLSDKFGVSTTLFALMLCIQGLWCCLNQSIAYPWVMRRFNIPIPYIAIAGMFLEAVCHVLIGLANNVFMGFAPIFVYFFGWSFVCPTCTSILSVLFFSPFSHRIDEFPSFCGRQSAFLGQFRHADGADRQSDGSLADLQL